MSYTSADQPGDPSIPDYRWVPTTPDPRQIHAITAALVAATVALFASSLQFAAHASLANVTLEWWPSLSRPDPSDKASALSV